MSHSQPTDQGVQDHGHHEHRHGAVDPSLLSSERGLWAVKWSFLGLFVTAALLLGIVLLSQLFHRLAL
jgi:hypothetical protein